MTPQFEAYFLWKGIRDEMIFLKNNYRDLGVPSDTWHELEEACKEAVKRIQLVGLYKSQ